LVHVHDLNISIVHSTPSQTDWHPTDFGHDREAPLLFEATLKAARPVVVCATLFKREGASEGVRRIGQGPQT
jgi:hypothetical protein